MTAFFTIVPSPGLSKRQHRIAVRRGPRAVAVTRPIDQLMEAARFDNVEVEDFTSEFHRAARGWLEEFAAHEVELRARLGNEFDQRQSDRRDMLRALDEGLLKRILVTGRAPVSDRR